MMTEVFLSFVPCAIGFCAVAFANLLYSICQHGYQRGIQVAEVEDQA